MIPSEEKPSWTTLNLCHVGALIYPIMLTQQAGEISESKAAELLSMNLEKYQHEKAAAIAAIMGVIEQLPSPLLLLLDVTKDRPC